MEETAEKKTKFGYGIRHIQIMCMFLTMLALFIGRSSMAVAILAMTDVRRINDTDVTIYEWDKNTQGIILSSFFWGYMAMQIPAGLLSKRYGGKPVMLGALVINAIVCGFLPILVQCGGWPVVCICRVIMGLTQACTFPANQTLLGRWLPAHERTSFSGFIYGASQLGIIISMAGSGVLAETRMGWKSIFYAVSIVMSGTAVVWYFFAASSPREHRFMTLEERFYIERELNTSDNKINRIPWKKILRTWTFWAIIIAQAGSTCSYTIFFVDMPTYLEQGLKISLKNSAFLSVLPYIGMMVGNILSANISERLLNSGFLSLPAARKIFNSIGFFGMAVGLVALSFIGPGQKTLAVVALVFALTLNGFYYSGYIMVYLDVSPNYAGVMFSITNFAANSCAILTPIVTSHILNNDPTDLRGWRIVFLLIAGVSVLTNFAFIFVAKTHRRDWDDPNFLTRVKATPEELSASLAAGKEETIF